MEAAGIEPASVVSSSGPWRAVATVLVPFALTSSPTDTGVLDLRMKKLPALDPGNFTCDVVAGARYEPVQIEMRPMERFLAGLARRTGRQVAVSGFDAGERGVRCRSIGSWSLCHRP